MNDALLRFRRAMARHLGQPITPEVAAAIEAEAFAEPDRTIDPASMGTSGYGGLTFEAAVLRDVLPELHALHAQHWAETEGYRHEAGAMHPDYDHMITAQRAGRMVQFLARDATGAIVGHIRWYVHTSTHTSTPYAGEDALFLLPQYRRGMNAVQFARFSIEAIARLGIREFRATTKTTTRAGLLFKRLGFTHAADQWVLVLPPKETNEEGLNNVL